ncbi:MAG: MFS transporter [Rhizobiaceae bacterium]
MRQQTAPNFLSIASIIASMTLMALGNGIMFAYVPFALSQAGEPMWVAGSAVTLIAGGGVIGCLIAGPLIARVGHARMFTAFSAIIILSAAIVALGTIPWAWLASRFLYGIAMNGNFIITQSWLNHSSDNSWRGRAMSVFYLGYVLGLGTGAFIFGQLPAAGNIAPLATIMFACIGILPIALTRLATPPPPQGVTIALVRTWRTSPVGLVGIMASGGLSMLVQGFTPIYAAQKGLSQGDVSLLLFLMQLGMLGVQVPLGALSDRIDRRLVLIGACVIIAAMALAAAQVTFANILVAALIFAIWSGATESVYSISNAHANDRARPEDYVPLASTMLVAWSAAAFVVPGVVTALTPTLGPSAFMYIIAGLALVFAAFVIVRLGRRDSVPEAQTENFEVRSAQIPNVENLLPENDSTEVDLSLPG